MPRSHEQRRSQRIQPFVAPCRLVEGGRHLSGFVVELSVHGARISCEEEAPSVGDRFVLEVRLGKQVAHSHIACEVKWVKSRDGRHDFGLTFTKVEPEDQRVLEEIVEEFKRRASQLA